MTKTSKKDLKRLQAFQLRNGEIDRSQSFQLEGNFLPTVFYIHLGILTKHSGIQSCPNSLCHGRWTFNGHGSYAHARD